VRGLQIHSGWTDNLDLKVNGVAEEKPSGKAKPSSDYPKPEITRKLYLKGMKSVYRYIAFDVETPNRYNNRMSAIGISVIEEGAIKEEFFSYVNPETHFDSFNIRLTGISENTVKDAPAFPILWKEKLEPFLSSGILVAHNAIFDLSVLNKCLSDYQVEWKQMARYCCTVQIGRRLLPGVSHKLNVLCDYYGIALDHHRAESDSHACAEILLRYLQSGAKESDFIRTYRFR